MDSLRNLSRHSLMGNRQVVRHRPLEAAFGGSNPSSPASDGLYKPFMTLYPMVAHLCRKGDFGCGNGSCGLGEGCGTFLGFVGVLVGVAGLGGAVVGAAPITKSFILYPP